MDVPMDEQNLADKLPTFVWNGEATSEHEFCCLDITVAIVAVPAMSCMLWMTLKLMG